MMYTSREARLVTLECKDKLCQGWTPVRRTLRSLCILIVVVILPQWALAEQQVCNRLDKEKSPYLQQHRANPVCWYPWGEAAFAAAKAQQKPIFLSIGYSTCYWCHVMEKDSFETEEVAAFLNEHFISIKVDREERPDVDHVYMQAVQSLTGRGGWPMSTVLTPEGKPFWGGTFFYRKRFMNILKSLNKQWQDNKEASVAQAAKLSKALSKPTVLEQSDLGESTLKNATTQLLRRADTEWGGFGGAPKFPQVTRLRFLLHEFSRTESPILGGQLKTTLLGMASGGMFDHLGGGFSRYSTDRKWLVPHFEKMLYDNGQLLELYAEAAMVFEAFDIEFATFCKQIVDQTIVYLDREMRDGSGTFYSAQDAGEVKKEGEYYLWSREELKELLGADEFEKLSAVYPVPEKGNFEGKVILSLLAERGLDDSLNRWQQSNSQELVSIREKLLQLRNSREAPHLDDKILTSWNALAASGLFKAYQVTGESRYRREGLQTLQFILGFLKEKKSGALLRRYRDNEARFSATLEDYSFLIKALLDAYEVTFDEAWLLEARSLQRTQNSALWNEERGAYLQSADKTLYVQAVDIYDSAVPSGESVALQNLARLFDYFPEENLEQRLTELLAFYSGPCNRSPLAVPGALMVVSNQVRGRKQLVISSSGGQGQEATTALADIRQAFLPHVSVAFRDVSASTSLPLLQDKGALGGKDTFYVCEDHVCKAPVTSWAEAKRLLDKQITNKEGE